MGFSNVLKSSSVPSIYTEHLKAVYNFLIVFQYQKNN